MNKYPEIKVGDVFNKWIVLEIGHNISYNLKSGKIKNIKASLCRCNCGLIKLVSNIALNSKKSKNCVNCSCKKYNTYDLTGDYGIGYTLKGEEFYFDLEDYDKIKDHCWRYSWDTHNPYLRANVKKIDKKNIQDFMHRIIFENIPNGASIDHINHKTYDNRKENLRIVTHSQNMANHTRKSNDKFVGVYFRKIENKYKAYIGFNKKTINLGSFKTEEDAIKARLEAELKYFGKDFAPQRHLFEQYGIGVEKNE